MKLRERALLLTNAKRVKIYDTAFKIKTAALSNEHYTITTLGKKFSMLNK